MSEIDWHAVGYRAYSTQSLAAPALCPVFRAWLDSANPPVGSREFTDNGRAWVGGWQAAADDAARAALEAQE